MNRRDILGNVVFSIAEILNAVDSAVIFSDYKQCHVVLSALLSKNMMCYNLNSQDLFRSSVTHSITLSCIKIQTILPWLVWLSGLSAGLGTERWLVRFLVRAHTWVAGQIPRWGHASLPLFLPPFLFL